MADPVFFASEAEFRHWLQANHQNAPELLVGFWKKGSGEPSIDWPQARDQALCFGWIDGVRKSLGDDAYTIRFTPRRKRSIWSNVNLERFEALKATGQMTAAGERALKESTGPKGVYAYEKPLAAFSHDDEQQFRANTTAWADWERRSPSYRKVVQHWVTSAKRPETREKRLATLIKCSAAGERIPGYDIGRKKAADSEHVVSGILCRIGSGLSFSTMGALLKLASMQGLNAPELVFYRSLFSLPVVLLFVLKRESLAALRPNNPLAHVWRSGLGLLSMGLTFQALILLPLADATAINFTAPIFATILSFVILKEDVRLHRWAAVVIGFIGVLIVARPGGSSLPALGVAIALMGALGQAGVTTMLRQIQRTENLSAIVFWFAIAGIVAGGLLMPLFGHAHGMTAMAYVIAGGLAGGLGQLFMTASLRAPVSVVAPFDYLQIVAATAYGWLLFSDVPTLHTIIGAALIAASGLYTAFREHRRRVRQAAAAVPAV